MNYVEYYTANPSVKQINQTTRIEENKTDNGKKVAFKGNKKKIALSLAGMAAVGIAGILLYKKFNIPKEGKVLQKGAEGIKEQAAGLIKEADGIKEQADTVLSDAKKLFLIYIRGFIFRIRILTILYARVLLMIIFILTMTFI